MSESKQEILNRLLLASFAISIIIATPLSLAEVTRAGIIDGIAVFMMMIATIFLSLAFVFTIMILMVAVPTITLRVFKRSN